ncbi:MAG: hypothetical protein ABL993_10430 [Vicinamibacterales bacterium]
MDPELRTPLIELIEKVGLLRRDLQHKGDLEKYEARIGRIERKFSALAELISRTDPECAKALRTAWQLPARSLAFRNAEHRKDEG